MATSQSACQDATVSRTCTSGPLPARTPTMSMNDIPIQLSPAQSEAQDILSHLLSRLKEPESKYYTRYGEWVERHPRLDDFCFRCIRPQVWSYLNGRWSLDAYVKFCYTVYLSIVVYCTLPASSSHLAPSRAQSTTERAIATSTCVKGLCSFYMNKNFEPLDLA